MAYTKTLELGKVDAYDSRRRINAVTIEITIDDSGELHIVGAIWNGSHTDWASGGQNHDEIAELFPNNAKVQSIVAVWKRWHLNHMRAGTPAQEEWLRKFGHGRDYTETLERLDSLADLAWDDDPREEGKRYKYGSAWLREELPAEIVATVKSW